MDATTPNSQRRPFSIKLWPPSENTRKMLVERMTNNLSSPTIFTLKYRSLSKEDAAKNAQQIEDAAFTIANQHYEKEPDGDGSSAVQLYAKECSKLILKILKKIPKKEDEELSYPEVVPATVQETCLDISKGQRAFIEADEAQELLKPLKEPGNTYSKICFSNRSFGLAAAHVAGPILAALKDQLKEVDLSDFVAGRIETEALDVMNIFAEALEGSNLKVLNLSENALGEKGVRAFGKLLQSLTNLEELSFINNGISKEAARAISELVPSTEKLKVLHLHNNMTGDEGAVAIAEIVKHSPLLEDFRCSSTRVGAEGGSALCEALGTCTHLRKLDLRDNMFGPEAGLALSKALGKHEKLTEVYLSYLNLEDEGAIAIANAISGSAPSLDVLEMAGNDITAEAAPAIASCIVGKQLLSKLNLGENELKDDGAIQIAKALEGHDQLKEVEMSQNGLRRAGARVLAQTVVNKQEFKLLNVNGNYISEEGVDELNEMFKESPEKLASLEDNDPEGEDGEDDDNEKGSGDEGKDAEDELESKLKNLEVKQDEE